jgi:O-acetyl-ADP-ribose deacetylase (regulator of RNase III)
VAVVNQVIREVVLENGQRVCLVRGDMTEEAVDAIVNAANRHLAHGAGLAGAIVRKGGEVIQKESDRAAPVEVGGAAITGAGTLPARFVIHAVGPRWGEGDEDAKLRRAALSSLSLARERGFESIALPAISAGIFGFPVDRCAQILVQAVVDFIGERAEGPPRTIRFTLMDERAITAFESEFRSRWGEP